MDTPLAIASRTAEKAQITAAVGIINNLPEPITYLDVGAAWGVDNPLVNLLRQTGKLKIIGVEPDEAEWRNLAAAFPKDQWLCCGLGDKDGEAQFNVTSHAAQSSFYESDLAAFPPGPRRDSAAVVKTIPMMMQRLDTLWAQGRTGVPDFVKIDAQGYELNILNGFGSLLGQVTGFRMETHLRPLYKGQPLFGDIYEFMQEHGFILRDIRVLPPEMYEAVELEVYFSARDAQRGDKLTLWELIHAIPMGRTLTARGDWTWMPL